MQIKFPVGISLLIFFATIATIFTMGTVIAKNQKNGNLNNPFKQVTQSLTGESSSDQATQITQTAVLSASDVAIHAQENDCWMIIANKVYNLSAYASLHPGGPQTVVKYCGKDGSTGFATKDKIPGSAHSGGAATLLSNYYIGTIGETNVNLAEIKPEPVKALVAQQEQTSNASTSTASTTTTTTSKTTTTGSTSQTLTTSEIAKHRSASDCWVIISDYAYNFSAYLTQHPGGVASITRYCGTDGTIGFNTKDNTPGSPHSTYAQGLLANYRIGKIGDAVAASVITSGSTPTATPTPASTPTPTTSTGSSTTVTLNSIEIAKHASASDCWMIISSKVYNFTNYLSQHPGGVGSMTPYCGQDGTVGFNTKGRSPGSAHSSYAQGLISNYLLGNFNAVTTPAPNQAPNATIQTTSVPTPVPTAIPTTPPSSSGTLTTSEVSKHSVRADCWMVISNKVYNFTAYLNLHPGGVNVMLSSCGKDGTTAFNNRGGTGAHSQSAKNQLNNYFLGTLNATSSTITAAPAAANPTPAPTTAGNGIPDSVNAKYPGATVLERERQDNGSWQIKLRYNGACRDIKVNASGTITSDKTC